MEREPIYCAEQVRGREESDRYLIILILCVFVFDHNSQATAGGISSSQTHSALTASCVRRNPVD